MNELFVELEKQYVDAIEKIRIAAKNRKPGEGIFGFGRKLSDEPCHMELIEGVQKVAEAMAKEATSQEAAKAIRYILERPECYEKVAQSMYWTMITAQGQVMPLIPCLNKEDALEIYTWYNKENPKRLRLPIQNDIVKALKART